MFPFRYSRPLLNRLATGMLALLIGAPAAAELAEIKVANQHSLAHLPLMIAKDQGLIEKHIAKRGLDTKVTWLSLVGSAAMIDGLLSGNVQVTSIGTSGFAILWDKTRGEVKAIGANTSQPMLLYTRDTNVNSMEDLGPKNRIGLPAVGTSPQAILLKMYASQKYGKDKFNHFDKLTVTIAHPDAYASVLSGSGNVDSHFASPPYPQWAQENIPEARVILNSEDVTGGPSTITAIIGTEKFRKENPQLFGAVVDAHREAIDLINADPRKAAEIFLRVSNNKRDSVDDTLAILQTPGFVFSYAPQNITRIPDAMFDLGLIKTQPKDWKDFFFPEAHDLAGS